MRSGHLRYAVMLFAALFCVQAAQAQKIKAVRDAESASILSIKIAKNLPEGDISKNLDTDGRGRSTLAENPDKIRQAFALCVPSGSKDVPPCVHRVFVTDLGTDETYEITGEEPGIEANRPVDNLKWIDNDIFSYERWTGPHFGHRYVVNFKLKKQTGAFVVSDQ